MIELNIHTADNLIIHDKKLQRLFPKFQSIFDHWVLGIRVPALGFMAQKAKLDFMNQLTADDVQALSDHLGDEVQVERIDYVTSKNHVVLVEALKDAWQDLSCRGDNFCISRDASQIYISLWK